MKTLLDAKLLENLEPNEEDLFILNKKVNVF